MLPDIERAHEHAKATLRWVTGFALLHSREMRYVALRSPHEYPFNDGRIVSGDGIDVPAGSWTDAFEEFQVEGSTALHARSTDNRGPYLVGPAARIGLCAGQLHPVARALLAETGLLETIRVNIFASIVARAVELVHATAEARDLVEAYRPPADPATRWQTRPGRAAWATEAPGGLCFHRHEIDDGGHIAACQIVPPTSQNQPAIDACLDGRLARIIVISSTMVYESARVSSTPEGTERTSPPPLSTYGFQKLATEYFARRAWEQYRLPYTIVRPSSPVGRSERRALLDLSSEGSVPRKLFTNHAVPDLVIKILSGEDPLHLSGEGTQMRNYIAARDLARGIRLAMELPEAANDDFNLGTAKGISILELSQRIWSRIHGNDRPFHYTSDTDYRYDVPYRVPDVRKAKAILGFEAKITLDEMLDEVFGWIREEMDAGTLTPATRA